MHSLEHRAYCPMLIECMKRRHNMEEIKKCRAIIQKGNIGIEWLEAEEMWAVVNLKTAAVITWIDDIDLRELLDALTE